MSTELHDQLRDLAAEAPAPTAGSADGLWRAGKRRQRRRTAAGAVAAFAVVAAGVGGVGAMLPRDADRYVPPAATNGAGALPDELHVPPRWTEPNEKAPVGPMAALLTASTGWSGSTHYVGVSATTGEYRTIDLPDGVAPESGPLDPDSVLSPSGRYIAYWLADKKAGARDVDVPGPPLTGIAVYDTTTGKVTRHEITSPHGLSAWDLVWVDDARLYLQAGEIQGAAGTDEASSSRTTGAGWIWDVEDATSGWSAFAAPRVGKVASVIASDGHGRLVVDLNGRGKKHLLVDLTGTPRSTPIAVGFGPYDATSSPMRASRDGSVALAASDDQGARLIVSLPDGLHRSWPKVRAYGLFGWVDATHIVAGVSLAGSADFRATIVSVDTTTGETKPLIALPHAQLNTPDLATDLLSAAPVHRPDPRTTLNTLWVSPVLVGLVLAGLVPLLAVLGLGVLRRRRVHG